MDDRWKIYSKFKNFRMELDCESDNDCRRNEFCAVDIGKCLKQKNLEFKERCTRNGGNFDIISIMI